MARNQPNGAAGKGAATAGCDATLGGAGRQSYLGLAGAAVLTRGAATVGSEFAAASNADESPTCSESVRETDRGEADGDDSSDGNGEQNSFDFSGALTDLGLDGRTTVTFRENDV